MTSIRGVIHDGVARPERPLEGCDGRPVLITFLDEEPPHVPPEDIDASWDRLLELVEKCKMDTGIEDLAHQHDHYLHGTPKRP